MKQETYDRGLWNGREEKERERETDKADSEGSQGHDGQHDGRKERWNPQINISSRSDEI